MIIWHENTIHTFRNFLRTQQQTADNEKASVPIEIPKDALCFTYCQIPVVYTISEKAGIQVHTTQGTAQEFDQLSLDKETSTKIFGRTGDVTQIQVAVPKEYLK